MTHSGTVDLLFEALADQHRRRLCEVLASRNESVDVAALVAQLRDGAVAANASLSPRQRLEIRLHHVHLPLLDDADVIDYYPAAGRIEPAPNLRVVETLLEATADETREPVA